jgi:plastocyanin
MMKGRSRPVPVPFFFFVQENYMRLRNIWVSTLGLALAASVIACGGGSSSKSADSAPAAAPGAQKIDMSTVGDVKGMAMIEGTAPMNAPIKMNADPVCVKANPSPQSQETYAVGSDGKSLEYVFVYVKDGLGNYIYDAPTEPAKIDQHNCRYHPHVFGMRVGQPLQIVNSDPTLHNIHALPKGNQEFNTGQPIQGMTTNHTFTAKEVMVPFKCDVHGWMNAYVGVLDHPYFATTDKDGKFELKSLPPGTYTIEAWHEKLGTATQSVTLGPKDTKEVNFTFKAPANPTATD